jgi:hypothetical protein
MSTALPAAETVAPLPVPPPDADPSLTPRQAAFADAYARQPNGAAAARIAGYAHNSAKVAAARNLRRSGVLLRIMARRREQALARAAQRERIAGILDEALAFARQRENPHALARIAGLLFKLEGLNDASVDDDRLLADADEEQLQSLLACYEIATGGADPEVPDPQSATIGELAERAAELMEAARGEARDLPGVRVADGYLDGLLDYLEQGVRGAADACAFARMLEDAAETGAAPPDPWGLEAGPEHAGAGA